MFDAVLNRGSVPRRRLGTGAIISIVLHVSLLAVALFLTSRVADQPLAEPEVKFFAAAPPPPPPPPAAPKARIERPKPKVQPRADTLIQPREVPEEKPPEADPQPEEAEDTSMEGGDPSGVPGGVPGGIIGSMGSGIGGTDVLPFGDGMTRPIADPSNKPIHYSREALEAQVEGTMLLKCTITTEGTVQNCRIIKPLPHMDQSVLQTVESWRFSPVTYQGRHVSVDYVIPVRLTIPK